MLGTPGWDLVLGTGVGTGTRRDQGTPRLGLALGLWCWDLGPMLTMLGLALGLGVGTLVLDLRWDSGCWGLAWVLHWVLHWDWRGTGLEHFPMSLSEIPTMESHICA
jgi:hypothetical protein